MPKKEISAGDWVRYRNGKSTYKVVSINDEKVLCQPLFGKTISYAEEDMEMFALMSLRLVSKQSIYSAYKRKLAALQETIKFIEENL